MLLFINPDEDDNDNDKNCSENEKNGKNILIIDDEDIDNDENNSENEKKKEINKLCSSYDEWKYFFIC